MLLPFGSSRTGLPATAGGDALTGADIRTQPCPRDFRALAPIGATQRGPRRLLAGSSGTGADMRVLLTGWPSFLYGEATAGDVLSMDAIGSALDAAGVPYDTAWSSVFRPGALRVEDAAPESYTHLVFTCGPAYGEQVRALHQRYARCRRIAVGVSIIDPADPAVTDFDVVIERDGGSRPPRRDLAAVPDVASLPVVGVILAPGQSEYAARRRHDEVADRLTAWLGSRDCARLPLDTRLDTNDWRCSSTPDQFAAIVERLDMVVTTRLHGLVLALRHGVPALAVDPVSGGAKVSAQARAWSWPALLAADELPEPAYSDSTGDARTDRLRGCFEWCLSPEGRSAAAGAARSFHPATDPLLGDLLAALDADAGARPADEPVTVRPRDGRASQW